MGLMAAAYDSYLPWFIKPLPALMQGMGKAAGEFGNEDCACRSDCRAPEVGPALGRGFGGHLAGDLTGARRWRTAGQVAGYEDEFAAPVLPGDVALKALATASDKLTADFGTWQTPWGKINRYQRLTGDIVQPFNDAKPSTPVGFTSSTWGSLAAFGARPYPTGQRSGTAPAATALLQWWSLAIKCAPGR